MVEAVESDLAGMPALAGTALAELTRSLARQYDEGETKVIGPLIRCLDTLARRAAAPVSAGQEVARGDRLDELAAQRAARRNRLAGARGADAADLDGAEHRPGGVGDGGA